MLVLHQQRGLRRLAEAVARPQLLELDAAAPVLLGQRVAAPLCVRSLPVHEHCALCKAQVRLHLEGRLGDVHAGLH